MTNSSIFFPMLTVATNGTNPINNFSGVCSSPKRMSTISCAATRSASILPPNCIEPVLSKTNTISKRLEIVLVLDNTGSMQLGGKIDALRVAAQDMVDILFGDEQTPEKLFMGLVPFVATVNIGKNMEEFVIFPGK